MHRKETSSDCKPYLRAIQDTQDILGGKWKVMIIGSLAFSKKRYMELHRAVEGIGSKMLSKELQELEVNGLVKRSILATRPITVEYELTDYGRTLQPVLDSLASWGQVHRAKIMNEVPSL
ncbi:winged helix-turn-helix transcriptional regulator [Spirosoma humi]